MEYVADLEKKYDQMIVDDKLQHDHIKSLQEKIKGIGSGDYEKGLSDGRKECIDSLDRAIELICECKKEE